MFNNAKIKNLEQRIKWLENSIDDLIWEKHNPAKFKKGDKIGNYKISTTYIKKDNIYNSTYRRRFYTVFNVKNNEIINFSENELLKCDL